jgi:Ca2+-binding RTX toxin-like protein
MSRPACRRLPAALLALGAVLGACGVAAAAIQGGGAATVPLVLIGADDDVTTDPLIQPPGVAANQSTRKADILGGGEKSDVLIGREGADAIVAGPGDDVIVGGTEFGSDLTQFPNSDAALGGPGNDVFIWSPGDGSDSFTGGEPAPTTTVVRNVSRVVVRNGRRVRVTSRRTVTVPSPQDDDVLVLGTLDLKSGDNFQPALGATPFGPLPTVNVSGANLPAAIGDSPPHPTVRGFCTFGPAPATSNWNFLVRFVAEGTNQVQATVRVRGVERVLCRTRGADAISEFRLGPLGAGPPAERTGFSAPAGSKLAAMVR